MIKRRPYRSYKDTESKWIGIIPEHWKVGPFKNLISIQNGADYKDVEADEGCPVIGSGGAFAFSSKAMYEGETVLLGRKGTIDKPLYYKGAFWAVDTMYWSKIPPSVNGRFAYYISTTIPFAMYATRTALPSMTKSTLGAHLVTYPEKAEQDQIARWLDREATRIDTLIAKKTRFIELLKEKRQAVIAKAVTKGLDDSVEMKDSGAFWIGKTPAHWAVCKLSYRYSVELGKMLDEKKLTGLHPVPYLRNKDVQWEQINSSNLPFMDIFPNERERYTVRSGDLLVCEGGDVGRAAIWKGADNIIGFQKALHRLRSLFPDRDLAEFYFYSLFTAKKSGLFEESGTKSTISHLPAEKFREYRFSFPPFNEQVKIVAYLREVTGRIDTLIEKTERSIELLKEHRSALITAAVTGKIDVREAA